MRKKLKSILIGFPLIVGGTVLAFGLVAYFSYMASVAPENKWEQLPGPGQPVSEILTIEPLRDVVVKTETGEVFTCYGGSTTCKATESPAEAQSSNTCIEGEIGFYLYMPGGKVKDSCIACSIAACSAAVLTDDNSLWIRIFQKYRLKTDTFTEVKTGLILGSFIGLVIWAVWALNTLLKALDGPYRI